MLSKERLQSMGLRIGQMRSNDEVHNGGWYNTLGEKLGWGDLSPKDMENISKSLGDGEVFVVIPESKSYWEFVTFKDHPTSSYFTQLIVDGKEQNPGQKYLIENASWVISKEEIYNVDYWHEDSHAKNIILNGK